MEMRWIKRITSGWAATAVAAVAISPAATIPAIASAEPVAQAARSCSLAGEWRSLGPTYVEQLHVTATSCGTGAKVIKAYNRCRLNSGGLKGRCNSRVRGFRCSEQRSSSPIQFVASARCTSGRAVVKFTYSENT